MSGYLGDPVAHADAVRLYQALNEFVARQVALEAWRRGKPPGDQSVPGGNRAKRRADAARARKRA